MDDRLSWMRFGGGQTVDALVAAPRHGDSDAVTAAIKEGRTPQKICPEKPAKPRQKNTAARRTVK